MENSVYYYMLKVRRGAALQVGGSSLTVQGRYFQRWATGYIQVQMDRLRGTDGVAMAGTAGTAGGAMVGTAGGGEAPHQPTSSMTLDERLPSPRTLFGVSRLSSPVGSSAQPSKSQLPLGRASMKFWQIAPSVDARNANAVLPVLGFGEVSGKANQADKTMASIDDDDDEEDGERIKTDWASQADAATSNADGSHKVYSARYGPNSPSGKPFTPKQIRSAPLPDYHDSESD